MTASDNPIDCARCGQPHPRCAGHNQQGLPCRRWPKRGVAVCPRHGGHAPQVLAAAERRAELERAEAAVITFGARRDIGPEEALLEEVGWTAGHVEWLRQQVQDLDPGGLSWGLAEERTGETGGRTFRAGEPVIVKLYREERKHLVDVCRAAAQAGVAERLVRVREREGRLLVAGLQVLAARLSLSAAQAAVWSEAVPDVLRQLAAGEIEGGAA